MTDASEQHQRLYQSLAGKVDALGVQMFWTRRHQERQLLLSGRMASWTLAKKTSLDTLADAEFRIFSQWGEDGIIEWLLQQTPVERKMFVEFGVENYQEANTRFLLLNRNWQGLILDGSEAYMESVRGEELYWRHHLDARAAFITRENIDQLLVEGGSAGDIGLLSIDIDGNDYWVWEAITSVNPRIVVCEYNPVFGDLYAVSVPYQSDFQRLEAHPSGQYFGASIKALRLLADKKGYTFVGSCANGINAFFLRNDVAESAIARIKNVKAYPSLHRDSRNEAGELTYTAGLGRAKLIADMPLALVDRPGEMTTLHSLGTIYSDEWLRGMGLEPEGE